jgi:hypothetical protein
LLIAWLALAAGTSGHWRSFHANGVSFRYPPGWVATAEPLTAVTSPQQIIALTSFPFSANVAGADGCEPREALDRMPANGAFVYGWEYGQVSAKLGISPSEFPPRPAHFKLTGLAHYECLGPRPGYMLRFSDSGWAFQIHVALGMKATAATRIAVLRTLDTFSVS